MSELAPPTVSECIAALEVAMHALPEGEKLLPEDIPTLHNFSEGVYVRTMILKPGQWIIGKKHKLPHIVIISQGSCFAASAEFGTAEITAPQIFSSPAGVKRSILANTELIWTTVHPNPSNTQDLAEIEANLIVSEEE